MLEEMNDAAAQAQANVMEWERNFRNAIMAKVNLDYMRMLWQAIPGDAKERLKREYPDYFEAAEEYLAISN